MQRKRSTWVRKADAPAIPGESSTEISVEDYMIGGPSEFKEDVNHESRWNDPGENYQEAPLEGFPEMRQDTYPGADWGEKGASSVEASEHRMASEYFNRKALEVTRIVSACLGSAASEGMVEKIAFAMMDMDDQAVMDFSSSLQQHRAADWSSMLAGDDQDKDDDDDDDDEVVEGAKKEMPDFIQKKIDEAKEDKKEDEGKDKSAGKIPGVPDGTGPGCKDKEDEDKDAGKIPGVPDGTGPGCKDKTSSDLETRLAEMESQAAQIRAQLYQQDQSPMMQDDPIQSDSDIIMDDVGLDQMVQDELGDAPGDLPLDALSSEQDSLAQAMQEQQIDTGSESDTGLFDSPDLQAAQAANVLLNPDSIVSSGPTASQEGVKRLGGAVITASVGGSDDLGGLWKSDPDVSGTL